MANDSVTAPRNMAKINGEVKVEDDDMDRLSAKKEILTQAMDQLYFTILDIEENIAQRKELLKKQEDAKKAALDKKIEDDTAKAAAEALEADLLKQQQKEERMKRMGKKLREERDMLSMGRDQLNADIKRHQGLMLSTIEELKRKVKTERQQFLNAVVKEVDAFRLPSAETIFGTQNEELIAVIKSLSDECLQLAA